MNPRQMQRHRSRESIPSKFSSEDLQSSLEESFGLLKVNKLKSYTSSQTTHQNLALKIQKKLNHLR